MKYMDSNVICFYCNKKYHVSNYIIKRAEKHGYKFFCSNFCREESKRTGKWIQCAECGKFVYREINKQNSSKSGFCFCTTSCASIYTNKLKDSYHGGDRNYREIAFKFHGEKCECCGYDEDICLLDAHHIDENRKNNNEENLAVLCPLCHAKITRGKYILIYRQLVLKE